jgi:hypothetical protein
MFTVHSSKNNFNKITCLLPPPRIMSTMLIRWTRLNSCHLLFIKIEYMKAYLICIHSGVSLMSHVSPEIAFNTSRKNGIEQTISVQILAKSNSDISLKFLLYKTEPPLRLHRAEHASEMLFTISRLMPYRTVGT